MSLLGTGRPAGPLARVPAAVLVVALAVLGLTTYLVDDVGVLAGSALAGLLALGLSGLRGRAAVRAVIGLVVFVGVVVLVTALTDTAAHALAHGLRLVAVLSFALAVTSSTTSTALLDLIDRGLAPFARFGLPVRRIGLAVTLTVRFVPEIRARYLEVREAQYARGLHNRPVAVLIPLLVRTFTDAEDIAAALDARCWDADQASR